MPISIEGDGSNRLQYRNERGSDAMRSYIESTLVSNTPEFDRIVRYELFWNFYDGNHWRAFNDTFLSFNYVKKFIDKTNSFLIGKDAFSFKISHLYNEPVDKLVESTAEGILDYHWKKSRKVVTCYELLQMGSVCGDAWVHLQWDNEKNAISIQVCDSRHCYPQFDAGDITKTVTFTLRIPLERNSDSYKIKAVQYTPDTITTWYQKDTAIDGNKFSVKETENPYGFIPVVHVQNQPVSKGYYSYSDMADILKLNKVYNEMNLEVKEIIDYFGSPTTVITGGRGQQLQRGVGALWSGLPPEANVFNLTLGEDLGSSLEFIKSLKNSMHEMSDVPESILGKLQNISNTSAAALQITYQPLIDQANRKWLMYGEGIEKINHYIFRMSRILDIDKVRLEKLPENFEHEYACSPVFTYGLPQDETSLLNQANLKLNMKIASRRQVMNDLNTPNVPEAIREIDEDQLNQGEIAAKVQAMSVQAVNESAPEKEEENSAPTAKPAPVKTPYNTNTNGNVSQK